MKKQSFFEIDGKTYDIGVTSLKRSASILDGSGAGRVKSGVMIRDIIGTYYNYSMSIDTSNISPKDYDELYELITAPVDYHTVTFPYGQKTLTFKAYISGAEDNLKKTEVYPENEWTDLEIKFVATGPQRIP